MHMQMHDVLQRSGQQVQCHGLLHCNECRPFVITRPFCHHRRAVSMGTGPGHPLATGHRVYNVNVNNLLAISRLDFDNSGEPGPQAKGVNHRVCMSGASTGSIATNGAARTDSTVMML